MKTRSLNFILILLSIALIPLTVSDKRLFLNLGEFRNETYIYPLLLAFIISAIQWINNGKISIPFRSIHFQSLLAFVLTCILVSVFSISNIVDNEFKGTSGIVRFIRQSLSLVFSVIVVPLVLYNVFKKIPFEVVFNRIRKIIFGSLVVVFIAAVLQIFSVILKQQWAHHIILWINGLSPILNLGEDFALERISSISHEPPFLGMYLIFVVPWIFYSIQQKPSKLKPYVFLLMAIILIIVSKSRAAQLFCLLEIIFFYSLVLIKKKQAVAGLVKMILIFVIALPFMLLLYSQEISGFFEKRLDSFNIVKNIETNNSNKTRLGTIVAGVETFSENPMVGVGYGQQGFYFITRYPDWAIKGNWEIERYLKKKESNFPPGFNFYVRLLAETGLLGFLMFGLFIYLLIYMGYARYKSTGNLEYLLFITIFVGFAANWIQIDTPRIYGFWVTFALYLIYDRKQRNVDPQNNHTYTTLQ